MNNAPCWMRIARRGALAALLSAVAPLHAFDINLADAPLFSNISVPGNLLLALSVEYPTAMAPAYLPTTTYSAASTYLGYFDPAKCYAYSRVNTGTSSSPDYSTSYFYPTGAATSHVCSGRWSGNYMNWASMQALDTFRSVLTGGYRSVDTSTLTVLTKTYNNNQGAWPLADPDRTLSSGVSGATPMSWSSVTTNTNEAGVSMYFTGTKTTNSTSNSNTLGPGCNTSTTCINRTDLGAAVNWDGVTAPVAGTVYRVYINVKVCDSSAGLEANCVQYGSNYKPEGLMQKYSQKLRYSAFSYLNIPTNPPTVLRDGGVMRARMKSIGPTKPVPGSSPVTNAAAEWDASTGVMATNPDSTDASATVTAAAAAGFTVSVPNSGAMNYLNKFGYTNKSYKWYDPVSELYYAGLRYYKNQGGVAAYSTLSGAGSSATANQWVDGFPVITTWDDPIDATAYSCQKHFVLGIGDANTGRDANLPGSNRYSADYSSGNEPGPLQPTEVSGDSSVNVQTATNMVGTLEGVSNLSTRNIGCCNGTFYMAGLAYDAHTQDIRSDLGGTQTVSTFWMDVLEWNTYISKNNNWYAAKYGGFTVPTGFSTYASGNNSSTLPLTSWYTNTDMVGSDRRPDNYFTAGNADAMKSGLVSAFANIASQSESATTTAISFATPNEASTGAVNFAASYNPSNWTGSLIASTISYAADGTPTLTPAWNARTVLSATAASSRKIVTCCTSAGAALAFTNAALSAATLSSRTYYTSFSNVPGVASGSQSAANFVAYLRGDRTQEVANGGVYRTRDFLLGDINNSKVEVVGPPKATYQDATNPGYNSFARSYSARTTVVYAGANDGMLHAFNGSTGATASGSELFAYVPSFVYGTSSTYSTSGIAILGNPAYSHRNFVDATPSSVDVDFNQIGTPTARAAATTRDWRTVLIGGLGKGGTGYYAIDVTDPSAWTSETAVAGKVLWEFTDPTMGYSYGNAVVVKTAKYGWTVVLSSGYNNSDGKGYIYLVNPKTGALMETLTTPTGSTTSPINLAQITAFIPDETDYTATALYAGDLQGNVWRVDLSGTSGSYSAPLAIATLADPSGTVQPVTTPVRVMIDPNSKKRYVMVGTGRLLDDSDIISTQVQSFYALIDGTASAFYTSATLPSGVSFPVTRAKLNANTNLLTGIGSAPTQPMGWYVDLGIASNGIAERITVMPAASNGLVGVGVNLPNGNACSPAGQNYIFAVGYADGKSVLLNSSGNALAKTVLSGGVVADIVFKNIAGRKRLYGGSSTGTLYVPPGNFSSGGSLSRLNWREVPTTD